MGTEDAKCQKTFINHQLDPDKVLPQLNFLSFYPSISYLDLASSNVKLIIEFNTCHQICQKVTCHKQNRRDLTHLKKERSRFVS